MRVQVGKRHAILALVGICGVAAVIGVLAGVGVFSGSSALPAMPTTGDYRPISIPSPVTGAVDPDSDARQGQDLTTVLSHGGGPRSYRVTVSNVSGIGFVN